MTDSDNYPLPEILETAIKSLTEETVPYTLANILETSILAASIGKDSLDLRGNIAQRLWYLFLEYGTMGEDGDLYYLRYGRLMSDIEHQLTSMNDLSESVKIDDTEWTKLTWLLEDQRKIIS